MLKDAIRKFVFLACFVAVIYAALWGIGSIGYVVGGSIGTFIGLGIFAAIVIFGGCLFEAWYDRNKIN